MRFENRKYQTECVKAWFADIVAGYNPVVALPTGSGKSVILCQTVEKILEEYPKANILVLSHTKEIIQQDYDAMLEFFPRFGLGIYSAGLGDKSISKITLGTIGSVYRNIEAFRDFDIAIVDEVHAVSHKSEGMYRKVFDAIDCQVAGLSATVFRTGHGYIYEENSHNKSKLLFNKLSYDLTNLDNFNMLVDEGYLCKLFPRGTKLTLNSDGIKITGGDYKIKELGERHDVTEINETIVSELLAYRKNYKKWLLFCINIKHADNIKNLLDESGISCEVLHTRTNSDRDKIFARYKRGAFQCLVTVGMATTGLDVPDIDLIGLLRPTKSPVLHVQMIGRGARPHQNKKHCVVLDFAGNVERLGPINDIKIYKRKKKGESRIMAKKCPNCRALNALAARRCFVCGTIFPPPRKKKNLTSKAGKKAIIAKRKDDWKKVDYITYQVHVKADSPSSLKVMYRVGNKTYSEWINLNNTGYPKYLADLWVENRDPTCNIFTTEHVFSRRDKLEKPTHIKVKRQKNGYYDVYDYKFAD